MKALVLAIVFAAACSGSKNKQEPTTGSGSAVLAKRIVISWGITAQGSSADVFLQTTDETGKQVSHPIGTFPGTCQVIKPAENMKAVTGVNCTAGDTGIELHAVISEGDIIVLRLNVQIGVAPDPMAREEIKRVKVPVGAAIGSA